MLRHYFISDDLTDFVKIEYELQQHGIDAPQVHVLSDNDAAIELHRLHEVAPVLKSDVVHATEIGAVIGVIAALFILDLAYILGWTETTAGWIPFIFLAVVVQVLRKAGNQRSGQHAQITHRSQMLGIGQAGGPRADCAASGRD